MSQAAIHTIVMRRIEFLHGAFMDASAGLADIQFVRVGPECNHANWLIGHHLWEKDVLLAEWPAGATLRPREFDELYGFGSDKLGPEAYPDCEELRRTIGDLHEATLAHLTAETLSEPGVGAPEPIPTRLDCAMHFIHDASYHLGQLSYVRRLAEG